MQKLFFILLVLMAPLSQAKKDFGMPAQDLPKEYQQTGSLVSIKIVPGSKETRLYLVGHQVGSIKISQMALTGRIKIGDQEKLIQFKKHQGYFSTPEKLQGDVNIELKMLDSQKTEEFRFKLLKD